MTLQDDGSFLDQVEKLVDSIEKGTSADIVVTLSPRSGRYGDFEVGIGAITAWLALAFFLHSPWVFKPLSVHLGLALGFLLGWSVARRVPGLIRLLVPPERQRHQVQVAAEAAVFSTGMTHTPGRNGLLVHLSSLEQAAVVLPDVGLAALVPAPTWQTLQTELEQALAHPHPQEAILKALETLRVSLARTCPPVEANPHHIPCRPRVLV